jgi:hypothetical protein
MIRYPSELLEKRRASARARRARRGGIVALVALAIQILAPLLHGPHGGHAWDESHASNSVAVSKADHDSSVGAAGDHDCSQCPVCVVIAHAVQPVVPTAAVRIAGAALNEFESVCEWGGGPGFIRVVTESGPRGPPTV